MLRAPGRRGQALDKGGKQDHCCPRGKDAAGDRNGRVASHGRKHRLDADVDDRRGSRHCLLGEQALSAHAARKLSEGEKAEIS